MVAKDKDAAQSIPTLGYIKELNVQYVTLVILLKLNEWISGAADGLHGLRSPVAYVAAAVVVAYGIGRLINKHFSDRRKTWRWSLGYKLGCMAWTVVIVMICASAACFGLAGIMVDLQSSGYNPFTSEPSHTELFEYFCDAVFGLLTSHFAELLPIFKNHVEVNATHYYLFAGSMVAFKLLVHSWLAVTVFLLAKKLFGGNPVEAIAGRFMSKEKD